MATAVAVLLMVAAALGSPLSTFRATVTTGAPQSRQDCLDGFVATANNTVVWPANMTHPDADANRVGVCAFSLSNASALSGAVATFRWFRPDAVARTARAG